MKARWFVGILLAIVMFSSACSTAAPDTSALDSAVAERDELTAQIADLENESANLNSEIDELNASLEVKSADLAQVEEDLAAAEEAEAEALREARMAAEDAAKAQDEAEALRLKYDAEIRAELQAAYDAEVVRACDEAKIEWQQAVTGIVRWDDKWDAVSSKSDMVATVEECSAAERSKTADEREAERLAACETVDVDALEKNPDKYNGTCIHMWARITQYDTATGICTFRADLSDRKSTRWYDYDGNAFFSSPTDPVCPELDGIDTDDFVEVWATGNGTYTYDTTAGGTATATLWQLESIKLIKKD